MLTLEHISETFRGLLQGSDIELISVQVHPQRGRVKYAIVLDHHQRGISIDELEHWSRRFEEELDMNSDVPRNYALDVSSPGISIPLTFEWQYVKNVGRELEVELEPAEAGAKAETFKAKLEGATGDTLTFADGRTVKLDQIRLAKVALPW